MPFSRTISILTLRISFLSSFIKAADEISLLIFQPHSVPHKRCVSDKHAYPNELAYIEIKHEQSFSWRMWKSVIQAIFIILIITTTAGNFHSMCASIYRESMKNLFTSYGKKAKWVLKYLMWFIQEDFLRMHGNVWEGFLLKRCRFWKWRIIKGARFSWTFLSLNFINVLGTFENHILILFLSAGTFPSLLKFFTPFAFVTHSDLRIHKLGTSMNEHAMVSSFLLWLIRFYQKKKETKFSDMKDLTWNLQRFTWIFMFFVASADFIWMWNLRACCESGLSIKDLYCFARLDFISSPASKDYTERFTRKNMLSFMFVTYILRKQESLLSFYHSCCYEISRT